MPEPFFEKLIPNQFRITKKNRVLLVHLEHPTAVVQTNCRYSNTTLHLEYLGRHLTCTPNANTSIWNKVFKSGVSTFCGRQPLKQLLSPLFNTLSHLFLEYFFNPFYLSASFLYPLKTSENR